MKIVVDACSLINIGNSGVAAEVLQLPHEYLMGSAVFEESDPLEPSLETARLSGRIVQVPDDQIDPQIYASVAHAALGDGETECIALALQYGWSVCTDDNLARRTGIARLGASRVIGSLRLLIHCVQAGFLLQDQAFVAYQRMLQQGAFLPRMIPADFSGAL